MLVRQNTDCSGTGNESTVSFPFTLFFSGFESGVTGEVTAFTQPGGTQVGHRSVTVDELGNRCELVDGTAPPGQYKIVYDFGSGTGKQKVIRLEAAPAPTPSGGPSPTESAAPPTTGPPTTGPPTTGPPTTGPTSTGSAPATPPPGTTSPTPPTSSVAGAGSVTFRPLSDRISDRALAPTGVDLVGPFVLGAGLLLSGAVLVAGSRRRRRKV